MAEGGEKKKRKAKRNLVVELPRVHEKFVGLVTVYFFKNLLHYIMGPTFYEKNGEIAMWRVWVWKDYRV